ncbi:MAG: DUF4906 domain-containing protein [Bacteroides sp.]|nr:DUF4906 domain-containing protein [Bacteroides sp.]
MMKYLQYYIFFLLALPVMVACQDDFPGGYYEVGDGEGIVSASVSFPDFGETDLSSRAAGDAIRSIDKLYILRYNAEEELIEKSRIDNFELSYDNNDRPVEGYDSNGNPVYNTSAETNTPVANFSMKIPFGRYHMYAVANIDIDSEWGDESNYDTVDKLLEHQVDWDNDNPAANTQMFGYFSNDDRAVGLRSTELVLVNSAHLKLRAWIKRIASKVTIAFDTRQLNDNVYIYIKSAAIRHIAKHAYVGRDNTPQKSDELYDVGETFYFGNADATHTDAKANYRNWRQLVNGDSIWGYNSEKTGRFSDGDFKKRMEHEHGEKVSALYFYENMQGKGKSKLQDADFDCEIDFPDPDPDTPGTGWKDEKPFGTYMEVEGYYICNDSVRPGRGPIKYRFMMGKDVETDYNAERNRHYKLTLQFKGYANDIDWHIDYAEEAKPGSVAPDTAYVSYLYNQRHTMAVRSTPRPGYRLEKVAATILQNEWRPDQVSDNELDANGYDYYNKRAWNMQMGTVAEPGTKYYANPRYDTQANDPDRKINHPNCEFGWLSLREVSKVMVDLNENDNGLSRDQCLKNLVSLARYNYFDAVEGDTYGSKGYREYVDIPTEDTPVEGQMSTKPAQEIELDGYYNVHLSINKRNGEKNYIINVPLYTRAKSIGWRWAVYTGANPYYEHERHAYVRTVMYFVDDKGNRYQDTCYTNVQQSERIDNPRGIFRDYNNLAPFKAELKASLLKNEGTREFKSIKSRGAWSAEIERDPYGLVRLSKGAEIVTGEGGKIEGRTGTDVSFTYTPNRVVGQSDAIGAIITVRYHDNQCIHKIVVRQGYGPVQLHAGGLEWSSLNVFDAENLVSSPLSVGSFFKYNDNLNYAIAESNNTRTNFGLHQNPGDNTSYTLRLPGGKTSTNTKWANIPYKGKDSKGFGEFKMSNGNTYRLPDKSEVYNELLREGSDIQFAFGIAYGDGATSTSETSDAYSYSDPGNNGVRDGKGVRCAIAYCLTHGDNILFPFGASGHGRRVTREWYATSSGGMNARRANGLLRYGDVGARLGGGNSATAKGPSGNVYTTAANDYRPMAYRLPEQFGALYWCGPEDPDYLSLEFNSANYQVNQFPTGNLNFDQTDMGGCDALLLRPVRVK